jgi:hypothetical protein
MNESAELGNGMPAVGMTRGPLRSREQSARKDFPLLSEVINAPAGRTCSALISSPAPHVTRTHSVRLGPQIPSSSGTSLGAVDHPKLLHASRRFSE